MDYSYLNQGGFDPSSCAMPGMTMDGSGGLSACNLGAYGDLGRCGQMPSSHQAAAAAAYGAYNSIRGFNPHVGGPGGGGGGSMSSGSCSMISRPRDHMQPPMFPTGKFT